MDSRISVSLDGNGWALVGCPFGSKPVSGPNDVQRSPFVSNPLGQSPDVTDVNAKEWWYTCSFPMPPVAKGHQVRLVFDGVDYFAEVWLNGSRLGSHESAYTAFDFDVTDRLSGYHHLWAASY